MAYSEKPTSETPASPGVKVPAIPSATESAGPDTEKFYHEDIGMGQECVKQNPDVGDYIDDDVSRPDGPLFDGPQAYPSAQLHSGADSEK